MQTKNHCNGAIASKLTAEIFVFDITDWLNKKIHLKQFEIGRHQSNFCVIFLRGIILPNGDWIRYSFVSLKLIEINFGMDRAPKVVLKEIFASMYS